MWGVVDVIERQSVVTLFELVVFLSLSLYFVLFCFILFFLPLPFSFPFLFLCRLDGWLGGCLRITDLHDEAGRGGGKNAMGSFCFL